MFAGNSNINNSPSSPPQARQDTGSREHQTERLDFKYWFQLLISRSVTLDNAGPLIARYSATATASVRHVVRQAGDTVSRMTPRRTRAGCVSPIHIKLANCALFKTPAPHSARRESRLETNIAGASGSKLHRLVKGQIGIASGTSMGMRSDGLVVYALVIQDDTQGLCSKREVPS